MVISLGLVVGATIVACLWWGWNIFSLELTTNFRDEATLPDIPYAEVISGELVFRLHGAVLIGRLRQPKSSDYYAIKQFEDFPSHIRDTVGMNGITISQAEKQDYYAAGRVPYHFVGYWRTQINNSPYMVAAQQWYGVRGGKGRFVVYVTPLLSSLPDGVDKMWIRAFEDDPTVFASPVLSWRDQEACVMVVKNEKLCGDFVSRNDHGSEVQRTWLNENIMPSLVEKGVYWLYVTGRSWR